MSPARKTSSLIAGNKSRIQIDSSSDENFSHITVGYSDDIREEMEALL